MAATPQTNNDKKGSAIYWYVGMLIIFILVIIAGFAVNICIMSKQFSKNEQAISKSHQVKNPLKSLQLDSTKIYKLKQEDLDKFNDHIDYLSDKVEGEVKRTQENNQYDIDRINTFLAIGIGLLAIIGGLLPLVINFFSRESLDKRMDSIQEEAKEIQTASNAAKLAAEGANEKAKTASDTVSGLDSKVKDAEKSIEEVKEAITPLKDGLKEVKEATRKIPYIDLLVFQNAVAKLTSTDALKLFIGASRYTDVATYLQNLIAAIDSFDNDLFENNTDFDVKYFKNVVTELKLALRMGPIRRIPDGRSFQEKIDEVVLQLTKLEKMETKDFKEQLKTVSTSLTELKVLVENKATV
jgi:archaellum component FlaC